MSLLWTQRGHLWWKRYVAYSGDGRVRAVVRKWVDGHWFASLAGTHGYMRDIPGGAMYRTAEDAMAAAESEINAAD